MYNKLIRMIQSKDSSSNFLYDLSKESGPTKVGGESENEDFFCNTEFKDDEPLWNTGSHGGSCNRLKGNNASEKRHFKFNNQDLKKKKKAEDNREDKTIKIKREGNSSCDHKKRDTVCKMSVRYINYAGESRVHNKADE